MPFLRLSSDRDKVGEQRFARVGLEARLQNHRLADITAPDSANLPRADLESAAAHRIEDGRENRRAIEARQAEPIHRAVAADQRGRPTVADDRVILDRE